MSGVKVTRDKVASVIKAVSDLATKDVLVGIPDSAPERKDGEPISNAQIGYIQETGAPEANIPAREETSKQLLAHIDSVAKGRVWFATHGQAAEYVRQQAKLGEPKARGGG